MVAFKVAPVSSFIIIIFCYFFMNNGKSVHKMGFSFVNMLVICFKRDHRTVILCQASATKAGEQNNLLAHSISFWIDEEQS